MDEIKRWKDIPRERIETFFNTRYQEELSELEDEDRRFRTLTIRYQDLARFEPLLAEGILDSPNRALPALEEVVRSLIAPPDDLTKIDLKILVKGLPESQACTVNDLRSDHIGRLISLQGMVRVATEVRPRIRRSIFECQRCGHVFGIIQDSSKFQEPYNCPNQACDRRGPFKLRLDRSEYIDAQNIRVQSLYDSLSGGEIPQTIDVQADGILTARVNPGDVAEFVGILRSFQRSTSTGKSTYFDLYLDCRGIEVLNKDELDPDEDDPETDAAVRALASSPDALDLAAKVIVPHIKGHDFPKRAVTLQLFSPPHIQRDDGTRVRGDIHILLCGDPGVAKSQILRRAARLRARSIYTSGKSTSGVGLTAAAVKDDAGRWAIEGGAMVLADGGLACIDELDKIDKDALGSIHEALEHQTISFMKAGINAILRCRCPVLAACNPRGERFDLSEDLPGQIGVPPALLSRFDLVYILVDNPDPEVSRATAEHILASYATSDNGDRPNDDLLKRWVSLARRECETVVLDDEASKRLVNFFAELREASFKDRARNIAITIRQFESLVRITKAAARLRLSTTATIDDAEMAISLVISSMDQVALDPATGKYDSGFIETGMAAPKMAANRKVIRAIEDFFTRNREWPSLKLIQIDLKDTAKMDGDQVERLVEKMIRTGMLYEPAPGQIRPVDGI